MLTTILELDGMNAVSICDGGCDCDRLVALGIDAAFPMEVAHSMNNRARRENMSMRLPDILL